MVALFAGDGIRTDEGISCAFRHGCKDNITCLQNVICRLLNELKLEFVGLCNLLAGIVLGVVA